ncbi:GlxA family transcriptional regulator [Nakamurella sp. PAMC28650]|nr:GlxA family transcriptional regulator [Nakamurella sp. PAMC28650]
MLDVTGPAEVFAEANLAGANYEISYVSPTGQPAMTSVGIRLPVNGPPQPFTDVDTVIVSGGEVLISRPVSGDLVETVALLAPRARRVVSICTGSFALAAAGLLDGRRATTHWRYAALLARIHPQVCVQPDALFVQDGQIFTSAGISAGMDLALALVEQDHGVDLARTVARNMVMFMQRPGGQSQFSAPLQHRPPQTASLRGLVELISAEPALEHTTISLAGRIGVSTRQLARMFATELDTTPAKYVGQIRLDHAKALLDAGHTVVSAAQSSGFGSAETMRRVFIARLGTPPSHYRGRFAGRDVDHD